MRQVKHWMTTDVITVEPRDSLHHAQQVIKTHKVRSLPVVLQGRLIGIITDRDVRDAMPSVFRRSPNTQDDLRGVHVEDVMTMSPIQIPPSLPLPDAARIMLLHSIGGLPVVNRGMLIGILTSSDLLRAQIALAEQNPSAHNIPLLPPDVIIEKLDAPQHSNMM